MQSYCLVAYVTIILISKRFGHAKSAWSTESSVDDHIYNQFMLNKIVSSVGHIFIFAWQTAQWFFLDTK